MITARRSHTGARSTRQALTAQPLLQSGDRLAGTEFLRRFSAMPEVKNAELINGIVYIASPVRAKQHGIPDKLVQGWLFNYVAHTPGTRAAANSTVRFDADNIPQADALLMIENGGQAKIGKDGYVHGAPELVVEFAASSAALDLHDKLDAYRRAGVCEYLVWRPEEKQCGWFILENDQFIPLNPDNGLLRSQTFPGLTLDLQALLDEHAAAVLAALNKTFCKTAHKAFATRLKRS